MSTLEAKRKPWMKFFPADWQADEGLRMCSLSARGLWIEMVATMHKSQRFGFLLIAGNSPTPSQIASSVGSDAKVVTAALKELEAWKVFSRDEQGVIFSRRMLRDQDSTEKNTVDGHGGGNPNLRRGTVPKEARERRYRRSDSPQKTARILAKSDGRCHWCKKVLQQDTPAHDFFHVDHVLAICDGGGNDEANLVAACARCNHDRARVDYTDPKPSGVSDHNRGTSDPNPRIASDPKAQRLEARGQKESEQPAPLPVPDSRAPQPIRDASTRIQQPSPNDPPTAWMHLADRNPDGTPKVEDWPGNPGHGCPKCAGTQLNIVAGLLCDAAGLGLDWRGDWRLLIAWLREGFDFHDVILPAVQRVASRPGYQPPSTLRYFEGAVREAAGRMRA